MSSAVYYRFRSQKTPSRAKFDGTGISVYDLKREIINSNALDATADQFELRLSNPDTGDEYTDDTEVVPRSTSVEARRIPITRHNTRDAALRYLSGHMVVNARNVSRREDSRKIDTPKPAASMRPVEGTSNNNFSSGNGTSAPGDEESQMAAMFQTQGELWQRTQEEMAGKAPIYNARAAPAVPERPPPTGYICHRCGQKGHWIAQCPTLSDPTWEAKRVRRTTGIPRSMLKTVAKPEDAEGGSYMVNADGEYVVALADDRSWQDFQRKQKELAQRTQRAVPEDLQCPLTHKLFDQPVKMPCCGKVYSEPAVTDALINSDFVCPNCGQQSVYLDQLQPDEVTEKRLQAWIEQENGPTASGPSDSGSNGNTFFPFMMPFMMGAAGGAQAQTQNVSPPTTAQPDAQVKEQRPGSTGVGVTNAVHLQSQASSGTAKPTSERSREEANIEGSSGSESDSEEDNGQVEAPKTGRRRSGRRGGRGGRNRKRRRKN